MRKPHSGTGEFTEEELEQQAAEVTKKRLDFIRSAAIWLRATQGHGPAFCWEQARALWDAKPEDL